VKIQIKTEHGYLSLQPDGRLEFRDRAGAWETFDIEGLTQAAPPAPPVRPGPSPLPPATGGRDLVVAVKTMLLREGHDLSGPCGAFAITKHVAWALKKTGAGLLSKPGGNNCEGYATDVIVYPDGQLVDILGDGGGANTPQWAEGEDIDPSRWRPPVEP